MWTKLALVLAVTTFGTSAHADRPDTWLTTKAKLALWTAGGVDSGRVSVDTRNGVVTLYGKVATPAMRDTAERRATAIKGVKSVRNLLQVVPEVARTVTKVADQQIKAEVEKRLTNDQVLLASAVRVKAVDAGVVLLAGTTASILDELIAVSDAGAVPGVTRVATEIVTSDRMTRADIERLERRASTKAADRRLTDEWVTTNVKLRLFADETVPALDISVDTRDGVVTLFGMVPTAAAKAAAAASAGRVDGVVRVADELQILPASLRPLVEAKDLQIARHVEEGFAHDSELANVRAVVKNGIVRLTGTVPSQLDNFEAALIARGVAGVHAVSDDLKVKYEK
ncbi:MAG: BON domain-containing protein [Polyangia bacterium]